MLPEQTVSPDEYDEQDELPVTIYRILRHIMAVSGQVDNPFVCYDSASLS
jgi:hypothetical protein